MKKILLILVLCLACSACSAEKAPSSPAETSTTEQTSDTAPSAAPTEAPPADPEPADPTAPSVTDPDAPTQTGPTDPTTETESATAPPDTAPTDPSQATLPEIPDPTVPSSTHPVHTDPTAAPTVPIAPPVTDPFSTDPPVTEPPATQPSDTDPEETPPQETEPPVTAPPVTSPPASNPSEQPTQCSHRYSLSDTRPATCTDTERRTYTCEICGDYYLTSVGSPIPHDYSDASCTRPKTCSGCGATSGSALGHYYNSKALCTRCGEAEPGPIEITVTVKNNKGSNLPNVTVNIFLGNAASPSATGVTGSDGKAHLLVDHLEPYRVVLSNIPSGISANSSYSFTTKLANINLTVQPVLDPMDHSRAEYAVGSTMADFTLTDTDGTVYELYDLLGEKDLVILDFWYCACIPCKSEFPFFDAALDTYGNRISLLAVNALDSESSIIDLRQDLGCRFPMLKDTVNLYLGFKVSAYPTTVFINRSGKILAIHKGAYSSQQAFFNDIQRFLS